MRRCIIRTAPECVLAILLISFSAGCASAPSTTVPTTIAKHDPAARRWAEYHVRTPAGHH